MNYWLLIIPVISAFIGWFTIWVVVKILFHPREPKKIMGITFQGIIPKRQQQFAEKLGKLVSDQFLSFSGIEDKISDPGNLEKILPMIEAHVDEFLRERLGKEIPVVSMFIGDKTIGRLKGAFMKEIESLFPKVMKQYAGNLRSEFDMEAIVIKKISGFSSAKLEKTLFDNLSRELRIAGLIGAVIGFIIGVAELLIIVLTS